MVLCWIALPVFAFLGLFSVKYRQLTKEAFDCLWRSFTLRPCRSSLDQRIRTDVTGSLMRLSPSLGKGFYKHYKTIAIIILIITILSTYVTAQGIYNYVKYGNCNGEESTAFCVINTALGNNQNQSILSLVPNQSCNDTFMPSP